MGSQNRRSNFVSSAKAWRLDCAVAKQPGWFSNEVSGPFEAFLCLKASVCTGVFRTGIPEIDSGLQALWTPLYYSIS